VARRPKPPEVGWNVYLISGRRRYVGHVMARDEAEAVRKAVEELEIAPALRDRIVVQRNE
jgi:hypothetical protein